MEHPSPPDVSNLYGLALEAAKPVVELLDGDITDNGRYSDVCAALQRAQELLARSVTAKAGESDGALLWVNTYLSRYFGADFQPAGRAAKDETEYIFRSSGIGVSQDVCDAAHGQIVEHLDKQGTHLSHAFQSPQTPLEVKIHVAKTSAHGDRVVFKPDAWLTDERREDLQWYGQALFHNEALEHSGYDLLYVHLGVGARRKLPLRGAGVYLMFADEEAWDRLKPWFVPAFRGFLSEILLAHVFSTERRARLGGQAELYREALQAFGHHAGKLMQESGFIDANVEAETRGQIELWEWRSTAARIWPVWGLGEAVRPLKSDGSGYPPNWFESSWPDGTWANVEPSRVAELVQAACVFYLAPRLGRGANGKEVGRWGVWEAEWNVAGKRRRQAFADLFAEARAAAISLPTLPPFAEHFQRPGTTSVTLGLAELIRNAVNYLSDCDRQLAHYARTGRWQGPMLRFTIEIDDEDVGVLVEHPATTPVGEEAPVSKSIGRIKAIERSALRIGENWVVQTSQPSAGLSGDVTVHTASWRYRFGLVAPARGGPQGGCNG